MLAALFSPFPYLYFYLFLVITTLHEMIPALKVLPLERMAFAATLLFSLLYLAERKRWKELWGPLLFFSLFFIGLPPLSSLANRDYLHILADGEYKSFVKILLLAPLLFLFHKDDERRKDHLLQVFTFSYFIFALIFLYRYLYLGEVREFDLRPLLKIRHGDPNYLCTYFSTAFPLTLYQGKRLLDQNHRLRAIFSFFVALILLICTLLTQSRMGLLATGVTLAFLLWKIDWKISRRVVVLAGPLCVLLGIALFPLVGPQIALRFKNIQDESNRERVRSLKNGVLMFVDSPLMGKGMHSAPRYYFENGGFPKEQSAVKRHEIHNTPLQILGELGLYGFTLYGLFVLWVLSLVMHPLKGQGQAFSLATLLALFINSLTIELAYKDLFLLFFFVVAVLNSGLTFVLNPKT